MSGDVGLPFFTSFEISKDLDWQMSRAEKYAFIGLLQDIKPQCALEIGTFRGGSLQVLSHFSDQVYSIDIDPSPKEKLSSRFHNVEFLVGKSADVLPDTIKNIQANNKTLEFVFIDGDHTKQGVYQDLKFFLDTKLKNTVHILLHDSFNPECRRGMKKAIQENSERLSYCELDFIGGSFWHNDTFREMWGGFALLKLEPEVQKTVVTESLKNHFDSTYLHSKHVIKDRLLFLRPLLKKVFPKRFNG